MGDFESIWILVQNFLNIDFYLYGFHLTWGNVLLYSLLGSLFVGVLIHFFKAHE